MQLLITRNEISAQQLVQGIHHPECGALVTFEGLVRNHDQGKKVLMLAYQAYEPMANKELAKILSEAKKEWPKIELLAVHRIGELNVGEVAVAIAVWAHHRHEAFVACEAIIDRIKMRVPIWKKEYYEDGKTEWVACHHHHES